MAAVAKSDGFKKLMRESAEVVEHCQLMLKNEWLRTQWLNANKHRNSITSNVLKSIYKVASMLCAQEHSLFAMWTKHHIVAEFLNEHHVKIMMFCDVAANNGHKAALQQHYCELHNLDVFPSPFIQKPPSPVAPPMDQEDLVHIRGGRGEDNDKLLNLQDVLGFSEDEGSPGTNEGTVFRVEGSPLKDSQFCSQLPSETQIRRRSSRPKRSNRTMQTLPLRRWDSE